MDFTPLHYACIQDDISAIISLLREGAAVNVPAGDLSPLHVAASSGHAETCKLLLSAGANVDAQFPLGDMSALHYAAREGQEGVVRILLDAGADVNLVPENGQTGLHKAAARMGSVSLVRLLLTRGASVQSKDQNHSTPLHLTRSAEVAALLVAAGADPNARDKLGMTPAHVAPLHIYDDLPAVLNVLADAGADLNAGDAEGRPPLQNLTIIPWKEPAVVALVAGGANDWQAELPLLFRRLPLSQQILVREMLLCLHRLNTEKEVRMYILSLAMETNDDDDKDAVRHSFLPR